MVRYPFLFWFCLISAYYEHGLAEKHVKFVHVGAVLDQGTLLGKTGQASILAALEDFYDVHFNYSTRLVIHARDSGGDVAGAAWEAHHLLKDVGVQAILGPQTATQAELLADFGQKTEVPIVSFSATSPSVSPAEKPYFVRAASDDTAQTNAISSLLGYFGFKEVIPISDGTSPGASWVAHLVDVLHAEGIQIPYTTSIAHRSTDDQIGEELRRLIGKRARVFVVHLSSPLATRLFLKAKDMGLMGDGYVWVVTDKLVNCLHELDPSQLQAMRGVLGVRPSLPEESELQHLTARLELKLREENSSVGLKQLNILDLWAYDAVWALARAVETAASAGPSSRHAGRGFRRKLVAEISKARFRGKSGEFDLSGGQLKPSAYQVLNVVGEKTTVVSRWSKNSDKIAFSSPAAVGEKIVWPGDSSSASRGWEMLAGGKKLRVLVPNASSFTELVKVEFDPAVASGMSFSGFCIDVFNTVITSVLRYKVDYEYTIAETSSSYNELMDLLLSKKYDAIVGDVTIMANRSEYVDFTLPYTETGVWMLVRTEQNDSTNGWIFLDPLQNDLWGGALAFFLFTGFVVWAIEHNGNPRFRGPPTEQLGATVYFAFSTLVFAHRSVSDEIHRTIPLSNHIFSSSTEDGLRSNLSRLVVIVWVFVVLILTSSYTASLASMLTVQRLQPATVEDLLRNGDSVGFQRGSFVGNLLLDMNFDPSKIKGYNSAEEYEEALSKGSREGGVTAVFDEMPYLRIFLSSRCSQYSVFGPVLNTKGFGFVFPRGSVLAADASRAILEATEKGVLAPLEKKWFGDEISCRLKNAAYQPPKLSFKRFSGLFILSGAVSATALVVFLTKYACENWGQLGAVSSEMPFWRRIGGWVTTDMSRATVLETTQTNEADTVEIGEGAIAYRPAIKGQAEPSVELQELGLQLGTCRVHPS